MKNKFFPYLLGWSIILLSFFVFSQNTVHGSPNHDVPNIDEFRSSFYYILDNRFEGKSDAFIDIFNATVTYPEEAKENCRMGLSKISFTVDKDGKMSDVKYNQELGFGIDKALATFFKKVEGKWKTGNRSSEFEMTVGFRIKNGRINYQPDADLIVSATPLYKFSTGDNSCGNTEELFKKMKKYIKKKKYKKAKPIVEELLRRFPDDSVVQKNYDSVKNSK